MAALMTSSSDKFDANALLQCMYHFLCIHTYAQDTLIIIREIGTMNTRTNVSTVLDLLKPSSLSEIIFSYILQNHGEFKRMFYLLNILIH